MTEIFGYYIKEKGQNILYTIMIENGSNQDKIMKQIKSELSSSGMKSRFQWILRKGQFLRRHVQMICVHDS
jgi:hypothetical protein